MDKNYCNGWVKKIVAKKFTIQGSVMWVKSLFWFLTCQMQVRILIYAKLHTTMKRMYRTFHIHLRFGVI